mmetsp:Transcript_1193/g.4194  ORF Transcript_1193/g.4194 Transcript_1193/m.4194 type:complete len:488 (-) Transcript_1193:338-1801(-)
MVSFPAKRSQTSFPTANGSTALLRLPIGVAPGLAQTPYVPTDGPAGALYSSAKRSAVRPPKDAAALRLGSGCGGGGICRGTTRRASTSAGRAATRGSARLPRCGSRTAARGAAAQGAGLTGAGRGLAPGGGLAAGGGLAGAAASRGIGTAGAGAAAGAGTTGGATGGAAGGAAAGAGATRGAAGGGPAGGAEVAAASSSEGCCSPDSEPTPPSCAARGGAASSAGSSPASVATSACAASPACAASSASPISASASSGGGSSADASTSAISLSAGAAPSSAASSASASSPIALATLCSRSRDGDGEQTSSAQRTEPGVLAPLRPLRTAGDSIGGGGCSSSGAGGGGEGGRRSCGMVAGRPAGRRPRTCAAARWSAAQNSGAVSSVLGVAAAAGPERDATQSAQIASTSPSAIFALAKTGPAARRLSVRVPRAAPPKRRRYAARSSSVIGGGPLGTATGVRLGGTVCGGAVSRASAPNELVADATPAER